MSQRRRRGFFLCPKDYFQLWSCPSLQIRDRETDGETDRTWAVQANASTILPFASSSPTYRLSFSQAPAPHHPYKGLHTPTSTHRWFTQTETITSSVHWKEMRKDKHRSDSVLCISTSVRGCSARICRADSLQPWTGDFTSVTKRLCHTLDTGRETFFSSEAMFESLRLVCMVHGCCLVEDLASD